MLLRLEKWIFQTWWIILFVLFCYGLFENGSNKKTRDLETLNMHLLDLQKEYAKQIKLHEELRLQLNSQSDPDWLELTLMRGLGLVPEKQIKVFFKNKDA